MDAVAGYNGGVDFASFRFISLSIAVSADYVLGTLG